MLHILHSRATGEQLDEMLETLDSYIKVAVDIRRGVLAGGGELHADCEAALLRDGSQQVDIWGADWVPSTNEVYFESLINIRPRHGNRSLEIQGLLIRQQVETIVRSFLEGV